MGAAGLIGVGLVGAIGGVGIAAAAQAPKVKAAFSGMADDVKKSTIAMSAPIQNVLVGLAGDMREMFSELKPEIRGLFTAVAPLVDVVGRGLTTAFGELVKGLGPLLDMAAPLVKVFAQQLGPTMASFVQGLKNILGPASSAGAAFQGFFQILQTILPFVGTLLGAFVKLGQQVIPVLLPVLQKLTATLTAGLAKALPDIGRALTTLLPALGTLFSALATAVLALSPILPPLAKAFADIFTAIAPLIPQIVSHLTPIIVALIPPLGQLIQALIPIVPPLLKILDAFLPLVPLLANVAVTIVKALLPALIPFLNVVAQLANKFAGALMTAIVQSIPSLVSLAKSFGQILTAVTPLIGPIAQLAVTATPLITLFTKIAAVIAKTLVPAFQGVAVVAAVAAHGVGVAFKLMMDVVLSAIIGILGAASHLPFVGKKFGEARDAVKDFKTQSDRNLEGFISETDRARRLAIANIGGIAPGIKGQVPKVKTAAQQIAASVNAALNAIGHKVDINVTAHLQSILGKMSSPQLRGQAGMRLPGYGGGDILPALLEPGEAVIPKHLVAAIAPWAKAQGIPGFAAGGIAGRVWTYNAQGHPPSTDTMAATIAKAAAANLGSLLGGVGSAGGLGGAIGMQRWSGVAAQALAMLGMSLANLPAMLRRGQLESGGRPDAVNRTDINWQQGHPSVGIWQMIAGTFAAHAGPFRGVGPFLYGVSLNALAQAFASSHYVKGRYGNWMAIDPAGRYGPRGYDQGGWLPTGLSLAYNGTGRPERVLPAGRGSGDIHVHLSGTFIGTDKATLSRWVVDAIHAEARSNGGRIFGPGGRGITL